MSVTVQQTWRVIAHRAMAGGLCAFSLTVLAVLILIRLAPRLGLLDAPGGRKTHASSTPAIGGVAIAVGCIPVAVAAYSVGRPLQSLAIASVIVLTAGVMDDLHDLRWYYRFGAQFAAALVLFYFGGVRVDSIGPVLGLQNRPLGLLSAPFTVLATAGLINAINMIDGMDGLAGAMVMAALAMLSAAALYAGNAGLALGVVVLMGGVAAFLAFNLRTPWTPRARIFLGNAGSEFLGLVIAWTCFRLTQTPDHPVTPVLAPFLIALPVIDCLVLMTHRIRRGQSPFAADRSHLHHLLLEAGFTSSEVLIVMVWATFTIGLTAALARIFHMPIPALLVAFLVLTVGYFAFTANRERAVATFAGLVRFVRGRTQAAPINPDSPAAVDPLSGAALEPARPPADEAAALGPGRSAAQDKPSPLVA